MAREQLAGWGGTSPSVADVTHPRSSAEVGAIIATRPYRGLIARGLGRSYGDAAQNAGGTVMDATGLDAHRWVDRSGGVIAVAGGTSLDSLLRAIVPAGWFVPVSPGTRQVTVGGAVAADIHGKNHHCDGSFVSHMTAFTLATPTGVTTVTPESDGELFWATAGGLGLTGVILEVTVRLLRVRTSAIRVLSERGSDLDDVMARMDRRDERHRYSVAWVDGLGRGRHFGRGVITWGDHAEPQDLPVRQRRDPLAFDGGSGLELPGVPLPRLVSTPAVTAFNEAWFRRAPAAPRTTIEPLASFFHPLDAVGGWNRLYGRHGFVQYQFVVPFGAEDVVRTALERLRTAGCPSFLAVLKRMGEPSPGPLSFPRPGWTLALDVPAGRADLSPVLDGIDDAVAAAGGRVYLAKDSRLRPEMVPVMYPELGRWLAVKRRIDPEAVFTSDLGRRLGLVPPHGPV
jgi:decaprenylphospho-beta-D-ribofuranose 2-oxidase